MPAVVQRSTVWDCPYPRVTYIVGEPIDHPQFLRLGTYKYMQVTPAFCTGFSSAPVGIGWDILTFEIVRKKLTTFLYAA